MVNIKIKSYIMNNIITNTRKFLLHMVLLGAIVYGLVACQKNMGDYYGYENKNIAYNGTSFDFLQNNIGIYDSLLYVLERLPHLRDSLKSNSGVEVTLFAPTNQSFSLALNNLNALRKLQSKVPLYLARADSAQLDTLMRRYILPSIITTDSIINFSDGRLFNSVSNDSVPGTKYAMHLKYERRNSSGFVNSGPQLIAFSDPKKTQFQRYWVRTFTFSVNIHTKSGIIHILAPSHEFGFGEFTDRMNY